MSNDEEAPSRLGSKIKKVFGFLKNEGITHKLGKSPISLNSDILKDPGVKKVVETAKTVLDNDHEDHGDSVMTKKA